MPNRRLPNSNPTRDKALTAAKEYKDSLPAPPIIPLTPGTITHLDTFFATYKAKVEAAEAALQLQIGISNQIKTAKQMAEWLISDFYEALQRGIRRGAIDASVRVSYGLDGNEGSTPQIRTEAEVGFWGGKAATGEAARIAAGGAPITYPAIAEVTTAVTAFKDLNHQQANAKIAYEMALGEIEALNPEADKLILKIWNETETTFDEGNKPSMRHKAREWGVIYLPSPGEAPSPVDFSIIGTVTDSITGNPVSDVSVTVQSTGDNSVSDSHGKYFIGALPAGTYSLLLQKAGYTDSVASGLIVTDGAITTRNLSLGGVAIQEGSVGIDVTAGFDISAYNITPATNVVIEVTLNGIDISAAPTLAGGPGPIVWPVPISIVAKQISEFATLTGAGGANTFIHIHNPGPLVAHYKITFNNLAP